MQIDEKQVNALAADAPMLARLLAWAHNEDEVRAAVLNGSRANPNAPIDPWQDFDILIAERTPDHFLAHPEFLDAFGPRIVMQETHGYHLPGGDWQDVSAAEYEAHRSSGALPGIHHYHLMAIFADGVRVDFSFVPADLAAPTFNDSMTIPLLDKDDLIPELPPTSDSGYWVKQPTPVEFRAVCNELFWVSTYVAKGLLRGELVYAQHLLNVVRDQAQTLLEWTIGSRYAWRVNPGYRGKWLERFLAPEEWRMFLATYAPAEPEALWRALFATTTVGSNAARHLAATLGEEYIYDAGEEERTVAYLERLRAEAVAGK